MRKKQNVPSPEPKVVKATCSICDQSWELHSPDYEEPTIMDCVRILRAALEKANIKGRRSGSVG